MAKKVLTMIKLQVPGGAGLAAPPGTWSLMSVRTFLAMAREASGARARSS